MRTNTYPSKYAQPKEYLPLEKRNSNGMTSQDDPSEVSRQDIDNAQIVLKMLKKILKHR